ncbi:hypothetical protein BpHYR1_051016, partial [Brachionus plicatilis]
NFWFSYSNCLNQVLKWLNRFAKRSSNVRQCQLKKILKFKFKENYCAYKIDQCRLLVKCACCRIDLAHDACHSLPIVYLRKIEAKSSKDSKDKTNTAKTKAAKTAVEQTRNKKIKHKLYKNNLNIRRPNRVTLLAAAGVNGIRGDSVNPINPIGQFFQPVIPENHTDGVVMYFYKDFVSLNETFLKTSQNISIPNYQIIRSDRIGKAGGGKEIDTSNFEETTGFETILNQNIEITETAT